MSWTMWAFRYDEGEWARVPLKWYEGFFEGKTAAKDAEGIILRFALVGVQLDDREPEKATYPSFVVHEVGEGGLINRKREDQASRAGIQMALGDVLGGENDANVIAASPKFARREYEHLAKWTPTHEQNEGLMCALRALGVPC